MKRLLGLILTLTLMLPMPAFAAGCLNWATIGTYGMGSWAGGTNMVGGQAVPSAYEDKIYNQEDWHDEYENADTDCRWTAERNIRDASAIWPQDSGRIKQFFLGEMRKCQSKFESVYRESRNSFCEDGDLYLGDRISVPAAAPAADCDCGNDKYHSIKETQGGQSVYPTQVSDGNCYEWVTAGTYTMGTLSSLGDTKYGYSYDEVGGDTIGDTEKIRDKFNWDFAYSHNKNNCRREHERYMILSTGEYKSHWPLNIVTSFWDKELDNCTKYFEDVWNKYKAKDFCEDMPEESIPGVDYPVRVLQEEEPAWPVIDYSQYQQNTDGRRRTPCPKGWMADPWVDGKCVPFR